MDRDDFPVKFLVKLLGVAPFTGFAKMESATQGPSIPGAAGRTLEVGAGPIVTVFRGGRP